MSSIQEPWRYYAETRTADEKLYARIESLHPDQEGILNHVRLHRERDNLASNMSKFQEAYEKDLPEFRGLVESHNKPDESDQESGLYTTVMSALKRGFRGSRKQQYKETMSRLTTRWKDLDFEIENDMEPYREIMMALYAIRSSAAGIADVRQGHPGSQPTIPTQASSEAQTARTTFSPSDLDQSIYERSGSGEDISRRNSDIDTKSEQQGESIKPPSASSSKLA